MWPHSQRQGRAGQGLSSASAAVSVNSGSRRRFFSVLFCAGLPGIAAVVYFIVPSLLDGHPTSIPLWVLQLAVGLQSCVILVLAVWTGVALAPKLGLRSPAFQALASAQPWFQALRPQLLPGAMGGLLGAALLVAIAHHAPTSITTLHDKMAPPHIVARILYGGITEELMVRWGFMSAVLWALRRFLQRSHAAPRTCHVAVAIAVSAMAFGALHLPAAASLIGTLTTDVVVYVVLGNAAFGILAGYLFWRFGLECAIVAHSLTHLVAAALGY